MLIGLILLIVVGYFIYQAVSVDRGKIQRLLGYDHHQADRTPIEIIKERYAHGEISREEYQQLQNDLQQ